MGAEQLDLFREGDFQGGGLAASPAPIDMRANVPQVASDLDDDALIAALPGAGLADAPALAAEAGRRRLAAAVPALEALCRRLIGFGSDRPVPEQVAALGALLAIDGQPSARAVARLIAGDVFLGPSLAVAVATAARLRAPLTRAAVLGLLRHAEPAIRADACRCARPGPGVAEVLIDLTNDLHPEVAAAAACALGRMGRTEAHSALRILVRDRPSAEAIDALAMLADEEDIVLLARLGRARPDLAACVLSGLDGVENPRADTASAALRRWLCDDAATNDLGGV
jgi:hypothetical protein